MQEIAAPYRQRVDDEEHAAVHHAQRRDACPHVADGILHLIIYSILTQQCQRGDYRHHAADGGDDVARGRKLAEHGVEPCTGLVEEGMEDGELIEEGGEYQQTDKERVDDALGQHRAQGFGKRHAVVALQHAAAGKLADAGYEQAQCVGQEDRVDARGVARMLAQGGESQLPSPATECLCQYAEG